MKFFNHESDIPIIISDFRSLFYSLMLIITTSILIMNCSDDKTTNSGNDTFKMRATVNNTEWVSPAVFEIVVMYDIKALVVTGEKPNGDKITLAINSKVEKGVYSLNATDYAGYTINDEIFVSKSGTVEIKKLEPTLCEGTFNFESASSSSNNTASITNGTFKAKIK